MTEETNCTEAFASQNAGPARLSGRDSVFAQSKPPLIADTASRQATKKDSALTNNKFVSNAKVAIPRTQSGISPRYNGRVLRACGSCRQRKTKCSGDTPVCRQCREWRFTCNYPAGWKERTQKSLGHNRQVERLSKKAQEYEALLKELRNIVEYNAADQIKSLLNKYELDVDDSSSTSHSHLPNPQDETLVNDESSSPSSIGSLEAVDRVKEDLNRTEHTRATGFMGKISEITWMQQLQREADQCSRGPPGSLEPDQNKKTDDEIALHTVNYHLDDLDILAPGPVQLYATPPQQLADQLFENYLNTVHPFYPIINRPLFCAQYRTFFKSAARPGDKWLAILNMIFAISAKHAHATDAPWRGDDKDYLVYLTRARILSMNGDVLFSHPDLQQIQVEGLIAFYLLASDQINRAWRISALAVRSAIALGINMKSSSSTMPHVSQEARYRVWWCLYTFEHMLGIMTGRATCIQDGVCTSPFPIPFEEEQLHDQAAIEVLTNPYLRDERINNVMASSLVQRMPLNPANGMKNTHCFRKGDTTWMKSLPINFGLCHLYYCDLAVVAQEIVNKVYSVDCVMAPWAHIENRLSKLRSRTEIWQSSLPSALDFTINNDDNHDWLRCRLALAFHYYSARITLGRPCLCRRDARQKDPSQKRSFSHDMAVITLESASCMLDLIPDEPNAVQLYRICPWWCILHYLMQAATVLLLELAFGCVHMPEEEKRFVKLSKKAVCWLFALSKHSIASRRAWQLCDLNLRKLSKGMGYDISDMPSYPYSPQPTTTFSVHKSGQTAPSASGDYWGPQLADSMVSDSHQALDGRKFAEPSYFTPDLASLLTAEGRIIGDSYFPYDPISGEFIRSFFPNTSEEDHPGQN